MAGQTVKGKGRPSNSRIILDRLVLAHNPEQAAPNVFKGYGAGVDLVEEMGLEAKISRISAAVASRLENARDSALRLLDSEDGPEGRLSGPNARLGALRPWSSDDYPENVVFWAEAEFFANDRIVSGLIAHLVEHIAIGEELRQIALVARRRAEDELAQMPVAMTEFANRLVACGISREEVRFMSRARMEAVIAAIRGVDAGTPGLVPETLPLDADTGSRMVDGSVPGTVESPVTGGADGIADAADGTFSPRTGEGDSDVVGEPGSDAVDDVDARDSERGLDAPAETGSETHAGEESLIGEEDRDGRDDGSEMVPEDVAEPVSDGPPSTRWGVIDLERIGYVAEEVIASTDEDMRALKMPLPEVDTLVKLAVKGTPEYMNADGAQDNHDRKLVEKFFPAWMKRTGTRLTEAEQRVWALLLIELRAVGHGRNMGANGWFDGLVVPKGDGSARVVRIRAIDRSEEGLRDALSPQAG